MKGSLHLAFALVACCHEGEVRSGHVVAASVADAARDAPSAGRTFTDAAVADAAQDAPSAGRTFTDAAVADTVSPAPIDMGPGCRPEYLLCEGFETGHIDQSLWIPDRSAGVIEVSTTRAVTGRYSLHIHADPALTAGGVFHSIYETRTFSATTNTVFGRAFVYSPKPLFRGTWSLLWFSDTGPKSWSSLDGYPRTNGSYLRWSLHPGGHFEQSAAPYETDRWVCWEWMIAGETNEWRVWLDEKEVPSLTIVNRTGWVAPKLTEFHVGVQQRTTETTPMDTWVDDIVIASRRIGCAH